MGSAQVSFWQMNQIVKKLEDRLLGQFETLALRLSTEFPNVGARAYSVPVGSATEYQGHGIFVDCILTDARDDEVDNVCLNVRLAYLTTRPRINADVVWGHPSGHSEADFLEEWQSSREWPEVTDEILERLYADLPRLEDALVAAVRRRTPND